MVYSLSIWNITKKGDDFDKEVIDENGTSITLHYHGRDWNQKNASTVGFALGINSNVGIGGARGATFSLFDHPNGYGHYGGFTSGTNISFYSSIVIPYQNIYHEYGHLIDNLNNDMFSNSLGNRTAYSTDGTYLWGGRGVGRNINSGYVLVADYVYDPNWNNHQVDALQHPSSDPGEQWADLYANLVVGNIKDSNLLYYLLGGE